MASSSFGTDFVSFLKQSGARKLKQLKNSQVSLSLVWDLFRKRYFREKRLRMPPRSNHPCCFGATAAECGCERHPRIPIPICADFVAHSDVHGIKGGFGGPKLSSKNLLFTERRRQYEDFKFPSNEKAIQTGGEGGPSSSDLLPTDITLNLPTNKLLQIKSFREDNLQDCMSTINQHVYKRIRMISSTVTHRCVHRFRVNDRNKLIPVSVNESGQSTCSECGKLSDYLEQFKGGYPWKKDDMFSTSLNVPSVIIEANDGNGCRPGERLKGDKVEKGRLPRTKDNNQGKAKSSKQNRQVTEIPLSSALIYQKLE